MNAVAPCARQPLLRTDCPREQDFGPISLCAPGANSEYIARPSVQGRQHVPLHPAQPVARVSAAAGAAASLVQASPLGGTGSYIHWGVVQLSVTNFVIIILMIVVLALAVILPFPHRRDDSSGDDDER